MLEWITGGNGFYPAQRSEGMQNRSEADRGRLKPLSDLDRSSRRLQETQRLPLALLQVQVWGLPPTFLTACRAISIHLPLESTVKEGAALFSGEPRKEQRSGEGHLRRYIASKDTPLETLGELGQLRRSGSVGNDRGQQFSEDQLRWGRARRGTEDDSSKPAQQYIPGVKVEYPRPVNPASLRPTKALVPSSTDPSEHHQRSPGVHGGTEPQDNMTVALGKRPQIQNPLYPVTESSYSAYAVMFLSLIVFAVGIIGNLSVMCIVWHNYYMKSAWNSILASLAFWDFLILFFCLPVVIFNEITKKRLLGSISCRIVPFMEVSSLGVTTFSLCALGIDRFHAATSPQAKLRPIEHCHSIIAKLAVIWVGSMTLSTPEILLWQLAQDTSPVSGVVSDYCTMKPSQELPESIYSLVLTYQNARMWWYFGCYFCLPILFTVSCQLVTRRISSPDKSVCRSGKHGQCESQLNCTVIGLTVIYAICTIPENVSNIVVAYLSPDMAKQTLDLLNLVNQFFLFFKCSVTPVLLLCLCKPLGQAFMDCCCCCCEECGQEAVSSDGGSNSKLKTEMSSSIFFDKPQESPPPVGPIGTPC